jgi:uncharacterized protein YecT (DUF1311 family)
MVWGDLTVVRSIDILRVLGGSLLVFAVVCSGADLRSAVPSPVDSTLLSEGQSARERIRQAEDRLHALLDALRASLPADAWRTLRRVQGEWHEFVERDCAWERRFAKGGSMASLVQARCQERHTLDRIAKLKVFLCEGRGLAGPCEGSHRYDEK